MANFRVFCEEWTILLSCRGDVSSAKLLIEVLLCHIVISKHDHVVKSRHTKDMKIRNNLNYMAYSYIENQLKIVES